MKVQVKNISIALLVFSIVTGFTVIFGYFYRESTLNRTFEDREMLIAMRKIEKTQNKIDT